MAMTVAQKYIGQIAGFLGLLQGLVLVLISVLCLKYKHYHQYIFDSYMDFWNYLVSSQFFGNPNTFYVLSSNQKIFAGIYFILNVCWTFASAYVLMAISRYRAKISSSLKNWGSITMLVCTFDIILSGILLRDFAHCNSIGGAYYDILNSNIIQQGFCTTIYIPVLTIVAKGFVLLILNFVFAMLTYQIGKNQNTASVGSPVRTVMISLENNPVNTIPTAIPQSILPDQYARPFMNNPASSGISDYDNNVPINENPYSNRYPFPRNPLPENWTGQNMGVGYDQKNPNLSHYQQYQ